MAYCSGSRFFRETAPSGQDLNHVYGAEESLQGTELLTVVSPKLLTDVSPRLLSRISPQNLNRHWNIPGLNKQREVKYEAGHLKSYRAHE